MSAALLPAALAIRIGMAVAFRAAWSRPGLALAAALMTVAVPWRTGPEAAATFHLTPIDLAAALLVVVVAARLVLVADGGAGPLGSTVVLAPIVFAAAAVLSAVASDDVAVSASGLLRYVQLLVVLPLAVLVVLRSARDLRLFVAALVVVAVGEGLLGVVQFATGSGAGFGDEAIRAVGTFGAYDIQSLGKLSAAGLIAAAALGFTGRGRTALLGWATAAFLALPLAFSLSRGAWLAALAALVAMALVSPARRVVPIVVCVPLLVVAVLVTSSGGGALVERAASVAAVTSEPDRSVRDRYALWHVAASVWQERPLLGVGPKGFAAALDEKAPIDLGRRSDVQDARGGFRRVELLTPHSLYLLVLAELGVIGLFAFVAFLLTLLVGCGLRAARANQRGAPTTERLFATFSLGAITAYVVWSLYGDLGGPISVLEGFVLGACLWTASGRVPAAARPPSAPSPAESKTCALGELREQPAM